MTLTTLFEKIAGKQQKREKAKHSDYRKLVAMIADGSEPDADSVHRVLFENGKTLDDLRESVELLERRRGLRQAFDLLPALADERQQLTQQIAAADRVLAEADRQHDEATAGLYARLATIKHQVREGENAQRQLTDTCEDQDLLAELRSLTDALREANGRRAELEKETRQLRRWAESDRDEIAHANYPSRVEQLREQAEARDAKAEALEAHLAELRKRIAELDEREKAVRERMLGV